MLLVWSESQNTYICRKQSCVWRLPKLLTPHPQFHPASVASPAPKAGGYTLAGRWGGWGSIFWKTPDIGLASYNNLSTVRVLERLSTLGLEDLQESNTSLESACEREYFWIRVFTLINPIWIGDLGTDPKNRLFYIFVPDFDGFWTKFLF
jgi:hypothetical protein